MAEECVLSAAAAITSFPTSAAEAPDSRASLLLHMQATPERVIRRKESVRIQVWRRKKDRNKPRPLACVRAERRRNSCQASGANVIVSSSMQLVL